VSRPLAAALLAAVALVATGCRDTANSTSTGGNTVSVYSLLPLEGRATTAAHDIVDGEKLALQQAGGQVGKITVNFRSVDTSDNGRVTRGSAAKAARAAAQDNSAIAAIGALGDGEARTEIPLLNEASVALLSTAPLPASLDDDALYPLGPRTFSRLTRGAASPAPALRAVGRRVGPSYARVFGRPATPDALLGYSAMRAVLGAIRAASPHGNDRAAVARELQRVRPVA
jgi:branched-chain amino acid transport system substrate-binding protein